MKSLPGVTACLVAGGLTVAAGALGGCAAILDWSGYTGERDASVDASGAGEPEDAAERDAGAMLDASDAADASDGDARPEAAAPDGSFACSPATCGGCCTCGSGGVACTDCSSRGEGCSAAGQCVAPAADAAPLPMCVVSDCSVALCPAFVYTTTCCKSDQTCGCQVQIPMKGPCM